MKKKLQYSSIFSSIAIKPVVSAEKDKYLSKASLEQLKSFLPDLDIEKNHDLLPISFSACVVNRVNLNRDAITTATALKIYKTFINKPINLEHNRQKVVGCILTAGFSEFGTEKPLTEEEVKDYTKPFNITLGGAIWRTVNEDLANLVEDCADPSSENYLKVSTSWELAFHSINIARIEGSSKNLEDGNIISDENEINKIKSSLTCFGGSGVEDEYNLYRIPSEGELAVGIGITETPAAEVKGIAVASESKEIEAVATIELENNEIKISQAEIEHVNTNRIDMKITSLKDITDESLKVVKASSITEFVADEIKKFEETYLSEKKNKEDAEKLHRESIAKNEQELSSAKNEIDNLKKELSKLQDVISARQQEELFTARMAELDEEFDLDDEDRQALASDIKSLTDDSYAAYKKNFKVFFKNRKKGGKEDKSKEGKSMKEEAKASVEAKSEVVAEALDNAEVKTPAVPNTPSKETSLKEKYAAAFAPENILIKKR